MHFHLIGVCGTGMGALAGLLREAGHRVTGSDRAFEPPMGDALVRWGIELKQGYSPAHLAPAPDYVVIGNVCRPDNPEARAAIEQGLPYGSLPQTVHDHFLVQTRPFVVAGTHGKTTTTSMLAFVLDRCGLSPGFLIGGLPRDFPHSFRTAPPNAPFVIEGDEYDSAFFEKTPKFWRYAAQVAVINAIEHDHVDIYPDLAAYRQAFVRFIAGMPSDGLLFGYAADAEVRTLCRQAPCTVRWFATAGEDTADVAPDYLALPQPDGSFAVRCAAGEIGPFHAPLTGTHNLRNALVAAAMAHEGAGVALQEALGHLAAFGGVRRRQELRGTVAGVRVYDDFAHHPTAVAETLKGIRARHPDGRVIAVYEPRSATAARAMHQTSYPAAFAAADLTLLAPVGRKELAVAERLDVDEVAADIRAAGGQAEACVDVAQIIERLVQVCAAGDSVVVMSNGAFEGIHERLLAELALHQRSGGA